MDALHLLALHEETVPLFEAATLSQVSSARFGFAFLDAAAGKFYVGSCADDSGRANLGAVLTQVRRGEVRDCALHTRWQSSKHMTPAPCPGLAS